MALEWSSMVTKRKEKEKQTEKIKHSLTQGKDNYDLKVSELFYYKIKMKKSKVLLIILLCK